MAGQAIIAGPIPVPLRSLTGKAPPDHKKFYTNKCGAKAPSTI